MRQLLSGHRGKTALNICHMQLTSKVSHQSSVQVRTLLQPALRTQSFSSREVSLPSTRAWSVVQLSVILFRSAFLLSSSLRTFWNKKSHSHTAHCELAPITRARKPGIRIKCVTSWISMYGFHEERNISCHSISPIITDNISLFRKLFASIQGVK